MNEWWAELCEIMQPHHYCLNYRELYYAGYTPADVKEMVS